MNASTLQRGLDRINPGESQWRRYEGLIAVLLKKAFYPSLIDKPLLQVVTRAPNYRRDIVIQAISAYGLWYSWSIHFKGDLFVIECKNLSTPITSEEVDTTLKYMRRPGIANLGFIFTRHPPAKSAHDAVKDAYILDRKLILLIDDHDTFEFIRALDEPQGPELVFRRICRERILAM